MGSHRSLYDFIGMEQPGLENILNNSVGDDDESSLNLLASHYYDIDGMPSCLSNQRNFTVLSLNIQSIHAKWNLFTSTLASLREKKVEFSAITLQETWLDDDNGAFEIPGYVSFHQSRSCSLHSGLKTYVRTDYLSKKLDIYRTTETHDALFVSITDDLTQKTFSLANIYKPPRDSSNSNIQNFIDNLDSYLNSLIINVLLYS